jgi:hypothetical protein
MLAGRAAGKQGRTAGRAAGRAGQAGRGCAALANTAQGAYILPLPQQPQQPQPLEWIIIQSVCRPGSARFVCAGRSSCWVVSWVTSLWCTPTTMLTRGSPPTTPSPQSCTSRGSQVGGAEMGGWARGSEGKGYRGHAWVTEGVGGWMEGCVRKVAC